MVSSEAPFPLRSFVQVLHESMLDCKLLADVCIFPSVYYWGSLSDRLGRRPIILGGLCGVAVCTSLFGLGISFPMMLVFRFLSGASNGNVA